MPQTQGDAAGTPGIRESPPRYKGTRTTRPARRCNEQSKTACPAGGYRSKVVGKPRPRDSRGRGCWRKWRFVRRIDSHRIRRRTLPCSAPARGTEFGGVVREGSSRRIFNVRSSAPGGGRLEAERDQPVPGSARCNVNGRHRCIARLEESQQSRASPGNRVWGQRSRPTLRARTRAGSLAAGISPAPECRPPVRPDAREHEDAGET
jgi:hypothetical protein